MDASYPTESNCPMLYSTITFFQLMLLVFLAGMPVLMLAQQGNNQTDPLKKMTMEVLVTDLENNPRQGEEIVCVDTLTQNQYSGTTDENGISVIELPSGSTYLIRIKGIVEEQDYQVFSIPELQNNQKYGKSRFLIKYDPPKVYTLDNVYFNVNQARLRQRSYEELNELVSYMKRRENIRVEIAGHTDNVGTKADNLELSRLRAKQVKQYLVSEGIDSDRIEAKGYGEDRPVAGNNTATGRQKNRRTEVHILSSTSD
jgi:outer membrane protein OmpA-like peptidoglycan-associated protein